MKNIVIIGAGDLGKEVVWLIEDINKLKPTYVILGFLDSDESKTGKQFYGYKVLGTEEKLDGSLGKQACAIIAIQDGSARKKIVEGHPNFENWETIIHPTAVIAESTHVGKGCIFFPQVTVSVDTILEDFGLYYIHATVCNDCKLGCYVSVMSGTQVSERAEIGEGSSLSAGVTVYPNISIGRLVHVSAGAVVSKDYGDRAEVAGVGNKRIFFK